MSVAGVWPEAIDFLGRLPVVLEVSAAGLSGDGGLLLFRQLGERLGLTASFAACLDDPRDPELVAHPALQLVRQRVYGILADREDQDDADTYRTDPVFKLVCGRRPCDPDLASQPTLSRFENATSIASLKRLRPWLVDQFLASFASPPRRLTLDLDAVDDPAHGQQQLTCWHNYYDQNQYLPLLISCADNDSVLAASLRHGSAHAALGADDDLEYVVSRIRAAWPDVVIYVRADCAFGIPRLLDLCERLGLLYTLGLAGNAVLYRRSEGLFAQARLAWQRERALAAEGGRAAVPVRLFIGFWYRAAGWPARRWVVVKAEANEQGSQRRFVLTNRPGARQYPRACYEEYGQRGESENRHKELKCDLHLGRLSDHRFCANYFRLYLHVLAYALLVRLRRLVALPPEPTEPGRLPAEALEGEARRRHFRQRRRRDVLGEGQPATWRRLLIQVAVRVAQSSRRVLVQLAADWPHLGLFRQALQRLLAALDPPAPSTG